MEIVPININPENFFLLSPHKFVVSELRNELILTIASILTCMNHTDLLKKSKQEASLIGGGKIEIVESDITVTWGSDTCKVNCGFDRPNDPTRASQLAESIKSEILKWMNERS